MVLNVMGALFVITFVNNSDMHGKWAVVRRAGKIGKSDYQLHHGYSSASSYIRI